MTECVNCGNSIPKSSLMCPYCNAVQEERTILLQDMPQSMPQQLSDQQQVAYGQPMQPGANQQPNAYAAPSFQQSAPQITYPQQTPAQPAQQVQQPAVSNNFGKGLAIGIAATAVVAGIVIALILLL